MHLVEVFKTNINSLEQAKKVIQSIHHSLPDCEAKIILEDCDRVLRIKREDEINARLVIQIVNQCGFDCDLLPD
jgi:hypothetical protein